MIEAAPSVNFFISILDTGYSVWITIKLECYTCQKKSILLIKNFLLILIGLFVPKIEIVQKYVVCYSIDKCFKG